MTEPHDWADDPTLSAKDIQDRFHVLKMLLDDSIEVWYPTPEEWAGFKEYALQQLGLTYEELAQQARESNFQSSDARHIWVVIGQRDSP